MIQGRMLALGALLAATWAASCALDREGLFETTTPAGTETGTPSGTETGTTTGTTTGTATGTTTGTTTGTSTGSGGTGGSGGAGGNGAQGGGPTESDCLDGDDDDGDTLADCDDPDCDAYECVDANPLPGASYAYPVGLSDVCPAGTTEALRDDCDVDACACSATGGSCYEWANGYSNSSCTIGSGQVTPGCAPINYGNGDDRWTIGGVTRQSNGSCVSVTTGTALAAWRACTTSTVGHCANGRACVPHVETTTAQCVLQAGDVDCASPYSAKTVLYDSALGGCTCGCSLESDECPAGSLSVYTANGSCSGTPSSQVALDGQCRAVGWARSVQAEWLTSNVSCAPTVAPATDVAVSTLCCK